MDILRTIAIRTRVFLAAALLLVPLPAHANTAGEYDLKAAFLYNFAKFTDWPPVQGTPFAICVAGEDPFGPALRDMARGRQLDGRMLAVRYPKRVEEAAGCQILFFGAMPRAQLSDWLSQIRDRPILTVGEGSEFTEGGGMIGFRMVDHRVRFEINRAAAERAQLRLSSKLLSLALNLMEGTR